MAKQWYLSKTLWVTVVTFVVEVILLATQTLPLSNEAVTALLFINGTLTIILRTISSQRLTL